jgi:nitrogen regulatory protein P-II 1
MNVKLILAIIGPEKLAAIQAALDRRNVYLMTVSEVFGYGREQGPIEMYRGREYRRPVSKLRVELAVADAYADAAVSAIRAAAPIDDEGPVCDDRLFVMPLEEYALAGSR